MGHGAVRRRWRRHAVLVRCSGASGAMCDLVQVEAVGSRSQRRPCASCGIGATRPCLNPLSTEVEVSDGSLWCRPRPSVCRRSVRRVGRAHQKIFPTRTPCACVPRNGRSGQCWGCCAALRGASQGALVWMRNIGAGSRERWCCKQQPALQHNSLQHQRFRPLLLPGLSMWSRQQRLDLWFSSLSHLICVGGTLSTS